MMTRLNSVQPGGPAALAGADQPVGALHHQGLAEQRVAVEHGGGAGGAVVVLHGDVAGQLHAAPGALEVGVEYHANAGEELRQIGLADVVGYVAHVEGCAHRQQRWLPGRQADQGFRAQLV